MKKIIPMLTIVFSAVAIVSASYMIHQNTPKPAISEVRYKPPLSPASSGNEETQSVESPTRGYLGGIGIIEPAGESIAIGSELSGVVQKVFVTPGDFIEEGKPLFTLVDRVAIANVGVAKAKLIAEEAKLSELIGQIATLRARVESAQAQVMQAEATLANARLSFDRSEKLLKTNALAQEEYEEKRLARIVAEGKLVESRAKLREADASLDLMDGKNGAPTIEVQKAVIEQAKASLASNQTNLDQYTVVAPKSGTILQVKIRAGEFVQAAILSNPAITMGVIDPLHIRVDIDETEIGRFRSNANAVASLRGNSNKRVPLTYVRSEPYVTPKKSLTGGTSERVDTRVLQVIYSVSPEIVQAFPGQQVDVYIEVNQ